MIKSVLAATAILSAATAALAAPPAAHAHHGNLQVGLGAGVPLKTAVASGSYYYNGTKRSVCHMAVYSGTPRHLRNNTSYISYAGGVGCSTQNITIDADAQVLDGTVDRILAQSPHFGPYTTTDGAGHSGGYYTRPSTTQLQRVRGIIKLSLPNGRWENAPGCSGEGTPTIVCWITSAPFTHIPEAAGCSNPTECANAYRAYVEQNYGQEADSPAGEPDLGEGNVEDEVGEPAGEWTALPGTLAQQVQAGTLTLDVAKQRAAAAGAPVIHCNAKIARKVGGIHNIQSEGPDYQARKIIWSTQHSCAGGVGALHFVGNPDLVKEYPRGYLLQYGDPYNVVIGAGPDGRIRLKQRDHWFEPGARRTKRVRWHSTIEAPPDYQWINSDPFGNLSGISEGLTKCSRSSTGVYVKFLNVLKCTIWSYKFK